jgi:hypothetical protein
VVGNVFFAQSATIAHYNHDDFYEAFGICSFSTQSKDIKIGTWLQFSTTYACIDIHDALSIVVTSLHVTDKNLQV